MFKLVNPTNVVVPYKLFIELILLTEPVLPTPIAVFLQEQPRATPRVEPSLQKVA